MAMTSGGDTHVFIVRIRQEAREIAGAEPKWRGSVEHLPSRTKGHFETLDAMADFIARQAGIDAAP